jgi:hypothetical protein
MSCDNWTYCTAIVELVPCSTPTSGVDDYATPDANVERSLQLDRPGPTADRSKSKAHRHEVRLCIIPESTQTDPEYVWGDEGPIND